MFLLRGCHLLLLSQCWLLLLVTSSDNLQPGSLLQHLRSHLHPILHGRCILGIKQQVGDPGKVDQRCT